MHHQFGISALPSQTSFRGETVNGVAKCRLFSQASTVIGTLIIHNYISVHKKKISSGTQGTVRVELPPERHSK